MEIRSTPFYVKWFHALRDDNAKARIVKRLRRLQNGNPGHVNTVGGGVSKLKIDYGPGYRVYYVQRGPVLIVLLCGGDKDSQKRDIRKAIEIADTLE